MTTYYLFELTAMEPIALTLLVLGAVWTWDVLFSSPPKPSPPKTPEQELGEAVGKYLARGVKVDEIKIKMDD